MLILTPLEVNCMRGFSKTQVVGFFLTGAAVGMAVALLYAPKSGVETRKQIRRFSKKAVHQLDDLQNEDRKSTRLNSSHVAISYAVFCLKKKKKTSYTQKTFFD